MNFNQHEDLGNLNANAAYESREYIKHIYRQTTCMINSRGWNIFTESDAPEFEAF